MKKFILTETEKDAPDWKHTEFYDTLSDTQERMKELYRSLSIEANVDAVEKAELYERIAKVHLNNGNVIKWDIEERDLTPYEELLVRVKQQLPEGYSLIENTSSVTITNGRKDIHISIWNSCGDLFRAFFMGGYPFIISPRYQTRHNDGEGLDLAFFALLKPDGIHWRKDAWLLTTEEKKQVIKLAKEIINEGKYFRLWQTQKH